MQIVRGLITYARERPVAVAAAVIVTTALLAALA